jgi:hypothetical protein
MDRGYMLASVALKTRVQLHAAYALVFRIPFPSTEFATCSNELDAQKVLHVRPQTV